MPFTKLLSMLFSLVLLLPPLHLYLLGHSLIQNKLVLGQWG